MKDLYLHLGIDPHASAEEVAAALQLKPEMSVYSPILLDENTRAVYDRSHASLRAIGTLRQRLKLDTHDSWFGKTCPDFSPMRQTAILSKASTAAKASQSATEESREARPQKDLNSKPPARPKWLLPVSVAIIILIALVLISVFF